MNDSGRGRFQFKQFVIRQDRAAMKVGFDGVLLGAWSRVRGAQRVLDAGAGTGLLTLMVAQRLGACGEQAVMDAVEVDAEAVVNARDNVRGSPWSDWCAVHACSLQSFAPTSPYDLVICNPPYFRGGPRSPQRCRAVARHADSLSWPELCGWVRIWLSSAGWFSVIMPCTEATDAEQQALEHGLFCRRRRLVRSLPARVPHRELLEFSRQPGAMLTEALLTIETRRHVYSPEFRALTEEFYLGTVPAK